MSDFTQGVMIALVPALIVSLVTSYLTVRLSMRQFCSQRWWEKKSEAYYTVMEALAEIEYQYEEALRRFYNNTEVPEADQEKVSAACSLAKKQLMKYKAIGQFVIGKRSVAAIDVCLNELDQSSSFWLDDMERRLKEINECMEIVRIDGEGELKSRSGT